MRQFHPWLLEQIVAVPVPHLYPNTIFKSHLYNYFAFISVNSG